MHEGFILNSGGSLDRQKIKMEKLEAKLSTIEKTYNLIAGARTVKEIADKRGLTEETIIGHFEKLIKTARRGLTVKELEKFNTLDKTKFIKIKKAFDRLGKEAFAPIYKELDEKIEYRDLRLARLFV